MVVGTVRLRLHIPGAQSLKDRRAVVRRATDRVRARFNVSIAEVGDSSRWQVVTLGVAAVANDHAFVSEVLDRVVSQVASAVAGQAFVTGRETEVETREDSVAMGDFTAFEAKVGDGDDDDKA